MLNTSAGGILIIQQTYAREECQASSHGSQRHPSSGGGDDAVADCEHEVGTY